MRKSIVRSAAAEQGQQIDLTPMLDVVFIMLIFFIVTATFIKEAGVQVNRPVTETEEYLKQKILVAITANNEVWLNKKKVEPAGLKVQLKSMIQENPNGDLVIQADAKSTAEKYALVFDAARKAGIPATKIHIATESK